MLFSLIFVLLGALLAVELSSKPGYNKQTQDTSSTETMQSLQAFRATVPSIVKKLQQNQTMTKDELLGWVRHAAAMTSAASTATFDAHACANPVGANLTRTFVGTGVRAMLVRDELAQQTVLAFQGPSDLIEMSRMVYGKLTDVEGRFSVQSKYQESFLSVKQRILDALQIAQGAKPYPILITGHSSGAAIAVLMALAIKNTTNSDVSVVTLGEPKVGDEAFAAQVDGLFPPGSMRMLRAVHTLDSVPHAPIYSGSGFQHHAGEVWQFRDPAVSDNFVLCQGREDGNCSVSIKGPSFQVTPPSLAMNAEHWHYADIELGSRKSKQCGLSGGQPLYVLMMTSRARASLTPVPSEQVRARTSMAV